MCVRARYLLRVALLLLSGGENPPSDKTSLQTEKVKLKYQLSKGVGKQDLIDKKIVRNRIKNLSDMRIKILVVDDEKSIVEALRIALESDNCTVIEAHTGSKAIEKARGELPDLILLDIMLPDMTGYEVCNKLKKDPSTKSIPIIMLTGMSGTGDKIAGLDLGADDYITKPFDLNELKARIHSVLQ